ncbi:Rhodanese-like domain-containing protein 7 [Acorus calamus]|uniref:Rhodanese-like domain-containing protein 7 n=1 Tax=Acorus calamus TaxID=4465 RepID=A0AAV9C6G7_ACOCL|nr:Rhodanese-like domain-containing protein 7 [Acorus calamus]
MLSCSRPNPSRSIVPSIATGAGETLIPPKPLSSPSRTLRITGFPKMMSAVSRVSEADPPVAASEVPDLPPLVVVSFYRFADLPDHARLRKPLKDLCEEERVSGGIILAPEGINGSICGTREAVDKVLGFIQVDGRLKGLRMIESPVSPEEEAVHHGHTSHSPVGAGEDAPFRWDHVRVKLKKEIVSFGDPNVSPMKQVGKYVNPKDWNALITDPDTVSNAIFVHIKKHCIYEFHIESYA